MAIRHHILVSVVTALMILPLEAKSANTNRPSQNTTVEKFSPLASGNLKINGWIGNRMDVCVANRVMAQDIEKLVFPFRKRENGSWDTEYWGKWFTSAAFAYWYEPSAEHRNKIDRAVSELISTQTKDGQITGFAPHEQLGVNWDLWGRKYALHGLILHYDVTGDKRSLKSACKAADYIIDKVESGMIIPRLGTWGGTSSACIMTEFAKLYEHTGDERYRKAAQTVADQCEMSYDTNRRGLRLISDPADGVSPINREPLKSYEVLTSYEGLYEVYKATGEEKYLKGLTDFIDQLCENELMIHGSLSNNEFWFDGTKNQTGVLEQSTETCATAQWMLILYDMLKLTGDSRWADMLETALYNALVSAMVPEGNWWDYFAGFNDERVPSPIQHGDQAITCCVSSGPRGLMLTSLWAIMNAPDGIAVNLYGDIESETVLANGTKVGLSLHSSYPEDGEVIVKVSPEKETEFSILLRIPEWSKQNSLKVNGEKIECIPGEYAVIRRKWSAGDIIDLDLDMRTRVIKAPSGAPDIALARGPMLLSLDSRTVRPDDWRAVYVAYDADGYVDTKKINAPDGVWMAFEVPVYCRRGPGSQWMSEPIVVFDYPSAGNMFIEENGFRTWFPQPLYLPNAFNMGAWRLKYGDARPYIPFGKELNTKVADVTAKVRLLLNDNDFDVIVSNDLFSCDPAPGQSKELKVIYTRGGNEKTLTVPEGGRLSLPVGGYGPIKILSARYGLTKD